MYRAGLHALSLFAKLFLVFAESQIVPSIRMHRISCHDLVCLQLCCASGKAAHERIFLFLGHPVRLFDRLCEALLYFGLGAMQ